MAFPGEVLGLTTAELCATTESLDDTSLFVDVESVAPVEGPEAPVLVGSYRSKISIRVVIPSQIPS